MKPLFYDTREIKYKNSPGKKLQLRMHVPECACVYIENIAPTSLQNRLGV